MISATVSGRVARDGEVRSAGATPVLSFTIASDGFRNKEKVVDWVSVSLFGKRAESLAQHIVKGGFVIARGSLFVREYKGKDGTQKHALELKADDVELGPKSAGTSSGYGTSGAGNSSKHRTDPEDAPVDDLPGDSSIPF